MCGAPSIAVANPRQSETSVVARQEGIEPPTHSLEGCCSIQLSYWRFIDNGAARGRGARI
jgi:hypothetical protein